MTIATRRYPCHVDEETTVTRKLYLSQTEVPAP